MTIISKPLSGRQAKDYYQEDYSNVENNYYTYHDEVIGEWFGRLAAEMGLDGKLAAEMGLTGDVEWEQYERLVDGENPHTGENLAVWLPRERIVFQGDLFYYSARDVFPPSGRAAMNRFFAGWLRERRIEPEAIYGVHSSGAAAPALLELALKKIER